MSIVIEDPHLERLAKELAAAEGTSIESVVRESLISLAGRRGVGVPDRPLRDRLAELAREVDALPKKSAEDRRTAEEVLGYDEHGQW